MTSRYDALTEHLRRCTEVTVTLTFAELDRLVGPLPSSARRHAAWWANSRTAQYHARAWLDAGRRARPDLNAGLVRFERGTETVSRSRRNGPSTAAASGAPPAGRLLLEASGEQGSAIVRFAWKDAGPVALQEGKLAFPALPPLGGVYRFTLVPSDSGASAYVGESDNLARRMANYRNPGPSQPTNLRMRERLLATLLSGGSARVDVVLEVDLDSGTRSLDDKAARRMLENLMLIQLADAGHAIENL